MKKVSTKLILLLVFCAVIPMGVYGFISIKTFTDANRNSIKANYSEIAIRSAEQIERYVMNSIDILKAISRNINKIHLKGWQKERIVRNYVLNFQEFEDIYLTDTQGMQTIKSIGSERKNKSNDPAFTTALKQHTYRSEVYISENLVPSMTIAVPLIKLNKVVGVIVGEINLTNMWGLVDKITIGKQGYAYVVSKSGLLIAHGKDTEKADVLKGVNLKDERIIKDVLVGKLSSYEYTKKGVPVLGVGAPIKNLDWGIIIEQPLSEAWAAITRMTKELLLLIIVFIFIMTTIGYFGGRSQIVQPIKTLIKGTRAVSEGNLDKRVNIGTRDEFSELGQSFNYMTEKLILLQEDIRKKERAAFLGRIAGGLVHDLQHPIRNIESAGMLLNRADDTSIETFNRIVKREFKNINLFLDSLQNITKPVELTMVNVKIVAITNEIIESFIVEARKKNITIVKKFLVDDNFKISIDRFAIGRVFNNLIINAFYVMQDGGSLTIKIEKDDENPFLKVEFIDTGVGIPEKTLPKLFDDFMTSKKIGLGLGLAESKKIIKEHGGEIAVTSKIKQGATFIITLPVSKNT